MLLGSLFVSTGMAQDKAVIFSTEKEGKYLLFKANNTSDVPQQVTIELTKAEGLRDNKRPYKKLVAPNSEVVIKKVLITGKTYSYSYNHNYAISESYKKAKLLEAEKKKVAKIAEAEMVEKEAYQKLEEKYDINSGIVVFNKDSCPRCHRTTNYLIENDIDFKMINIENNKENNQFMWKVLEKNGITGRVVTPIIVVDGVVSHSHEDLMEFLKTLD